MKNYYEELQLLFPLDPLLVFVVAYVCPRSDIAYLCEHIDLPYAIALVAKKLNLVTKTADVSLLGCCQELLVILSYACSLIFCCASP